MNSPSGSYRRGKNCFALCLERTMVLATSHPFLPCISRLDYGEKDSVDEIRQRIHSLRQLVEEEVVGEKQQEDAAKKAAKKRKESMDTGSLLSFTFGRHFKSLCSCNY